MTNSALAQVDDFAALLDETLGTGGSFEGSVITGLIVGIDGDFAVIDVGLKSEGRVPLKEFATAGRNADIKAGDNVDVFVERYEDRNGEVVLSREKAKREEAWTLLEKSFEAQQRVTGIIFGRVKGGFTV
ncbi:MAG: S1 RNA-binding domain-containing protein, partial [Magnetospirillum sp.]